MARDQGRTKGSILPHTTEGLALWLAGAILVGSLQVAIAVSGAQPSLFQRAGMIVGLCGALGLAAVIAARSSRETAVADRAERERPATHEVSGFAGGFGDIRQAGRSSYIEGMEQWTHAMLELTEHTAAAAGDESDLALELTVASEDTRALGDLLRAQATQQLKATAVATLHSICSTWEADQARFDAIAASTDPEWHRRWRARWVVEGLLRHGFREPEPIALPYR